MTPTLYPVLDGFVLNSKLKPNLTFLSLALREHFTSLRRAGSYRTRWLTIPYDPKNIPIPANDSYEYQAYAVPGSVYWGWIFVGTPGVNYSVQVTDGCTGTDLWSEVVSMAVSSGSIAPGQGKQNLFPKLLVMGQPGMLNVQICNLGNTDSLNTQLILCGAEPISQELKK